VAVFNVVTLGRAVRVEHAEAWGVSFDAADEVSSIEDLIKRVLSGLSFVASTRSYG
jgi:hypothetical protein